MEKYTVQINKDNYFTVDSKIIESRGQIVRVVNLRSISGVIGEKFNLSDRKLKEIIHLYLHYINNVELLKKILKSKLKMKMMRSHHVQYRTKKSNFQII